MQFELMGIESEAPKLAVPGVPGAPGKKLTCPNLPLTSH